MTVTLDETLLTTSDLSALLQKPVATLASWRSRHVGPRWIKVGNDVRYRRSDVQAWLDEHASDRDRGER